MKIASIAIAAALIASVGAHAQDASAPPGPPNATQPPNRPNPLAAGAKMEPGQQSQADKDFAMTASEAGAAEVAEAKVMLEKASRPDVKAFARMMIQDHTKADNALKQIAAGEGVNLKARADAADQSKTEHLKAMKPGADLDQAYLSDQLAAHRHAIEIFEVEAKQGTDDRLKGFAQATLPTLKDHLDKITALTKSQPTASSAQ